MDDQNRSSRRDNSSNLSSLFEQYSKSLDKNSVALKEASIRFEKDIKQFLKDYEDANSKFVKQLSGGQVKSKTTGRTSSEEKARQDQEKKNAESYINAANTFDKSQKDFTGKGMTRFQKISSTTIKSLQIVGNRFISEFTNSVKSVMDSYNQNLSKITAQMQMSNNDYSMMYNEAAQYFKASGLNRQFSPTDYAQALSEVLDTGMRGSEARDLAYQNLIAKKLVPALSTNTLEYRRMAKQFGVSFSENIAAMAKYTESIYGAEGIEEGRLNSLIDSLGLQFRYANRGMSAADVERNWANLQGVFTAIGSQIGENTQEEIVSILEGSSTTMPGGASVAAFLSQAGLPSDVEKILSDEESLKKFISNYLKYASLDSQSLDVANVKSSEMGYSIRAQQEIGIATTNQTAEEIAEALFTTQSNYSKDKITSDQDRKLRQGFYTNINDQLTNLERNAVTPIATDLAEHYPRVEEGLSDLKGIASAILSVMMTQTISSSSSGLMNSISSFFGKGKGSSTPVNIKGKKGSLRTSSSKGTGSAIGKVGLGVAVGMSLSDLTSGYESAIESGDSAGTAAGKGLLSSITGVTETPESVGEILFNSFIKNAGKGALAGSIGGPWGALIGAVAGATSSLVHSLVEYNDTQNVLTRQTKEYNESLSKLDTSQDKYQKLVTNSASSLRALEKGTSMSTDEFEKLQQEYPTLLGHLTDQSQLDQKYVDILKRKIDYENKLAFDDTVGDLAASTSSGVEVAKTAVKAATDYPTAEMRFAAQYAAASSDEERQSVVDDWREVLGGDAEAEVKAAVASGEYLEHYGEQAQVVYEQLQSISDSITSSLYGFDLGKGDVDSLQKFVYSQGSAATKKERWDKVVDAFNDYNAVALSLLEIAGMLPDQGIYSASSLKQNESLIQPSRYSKLFSVRGSSPAFKVGLNTVPYDNFTANLHQGEMVLTSHNADLLRGLSSSTGVTGLLAGLTSISKASAVDQTSETSSSIASIIAISVADQTETISALLREIIDAMTNKTIVPESTIKFSQNVVSYQSR